MTLKEARILFTTLKAEHVLWINRSAGLGLGTRVAEGEGMDRITERDPTSDHMRTSLHHIGLAVDLDMYVNGEYQTTTEAHDASGRMWELRHPLCRWGGRFGDGNHYSIEWEGRK
jgi:hypothetical protein